MLGRPLAGWGQNLKGHLALLWGKFKGSDFGLLHWVLRPQQGQGSERLPRGTLAAFCSRAALLSPPCVLLGPGGQWEATGLRRLRAATSQLCYSGQVASSGASVVPPADSETPLVWI